MGIIDIILVTLGGIVVILYATFSILKLTRYRNRVKYLMQYENKTLIQAKEQANQEIYTKKSKRKAQEEEMKEQDKPFEN